MGENTDIQWATHSFQSHIGCTKVSPGCDHCYAEAANIRWKGGRNWGPGAPRQTLTDAYWRKPYQWNKRASLLGVKERVFCASQADVFDSEGPPEERLRLWQTIRDTPSLIWMLLTKRPHNIARMLPPDWGPSGYANVHLGTTIENRDAAELRISVLAKIPARVRFLSLEPLLEEVRLERYFWAFPPGSRVSKSLHTHPSGAIQWVIIGGESGPKARPFFAEWARSLIRECVDAGVAPFMKQLGRRPVYCGEELRLKDSHGGNWDEWPAHLADLKVREFPAGG